jgi:hypothetical protein
LGTYCLDLTPKEQYLSGWLWFRPVPLSALLVWCNASSRDWFICRFEFTEIVGHNLLGELIASQRREIVVEDLMDSQRPLSAEVDRRCHISDDWWLMALREIIASSRGTDEGVGGSRQVPKGSKIFS